MPQQPNNSNNTEDRYQAKKNKKEQEKESAEKVGSLAARGALDYATGGQAETIRKIPVVGKKLKKVEDKVGKKIAKVDKLTGGKVGKIAKKLDDAGALDAAEKGLDVAGGAMGGGAGAGAGAAKGGAAAGAASKGASGSKAGAGSGGKKTTKGPSSLGGGNKDSSDSSSGSALGDFGGSFNIFGMSPMKKWIIIGSAVLFMFFCAVSFTSVITSAEDEEFGISDKEREDETSNSTGVEYATKLVDVAEREIGNNEADGTHAKYLSFLGFGPNVHWCAAFVSWCANEAGIDVSIIPHTAGVSEFLAYFKKQGTFKSINSSYKPVPGDLIIWKALGRSHIGIVKEYDKDKLITIEGNSSDAVRQNTYSFSSLAGQGVVGFAHPNYPVSSSDDGATNVSGKTIVVPKGRGLGVYASREGDIAKMSLCCTPGRIKALWIKEGSKYDKKGFSKLYGRYMVATTVTFGKDGDKIDFYMSNGTILHVIKTDQKRLSDKGATKWGHDGGACILEFFGKPSIGNSPYTALGLRGTHVVKAVNGGSIFKK